MATEAKVTILRYDSTMDKDRRYQTYAVPAEGWKDQTILDTLRYIHEKLDPSISFRESCRIKAVCNICVILCNKKSVLSCDTPSTEEMLLEPLPNYPLIKDLVVRFGGSQPGEDTDPLK